MTTNQEGVHESVRGETGTAGTYLEDWHALFTSAGIASGTWNERMIAWVNQTLSASYTSLNDAMNAFAIDQGFSGWTDMNAIVFGGGGAAGEPYGLLLALTKPS